MASSTFQLLQILDTARGASGGAGLFGDGPALLIPLVLGALAGWIGHSGSAVMRISLWAAPGAGLVFMSGLIVPSATMVQSLNDWPVFAG